MEERERHVHTGSTTRAPQLRTNSAVCPTSYHGRDNAEEVDDVEDVEADDFNGPGVLLDWPGCSSKP